jgi:hypothetical protein
MVKWSDEAPPMASSSMYELEARFESVPSGMYANCIHGESNRRPRKRTALADRTKVVVQSPFRAGTFGVVCRSHTRRNERSAIERTALREGSASCSSKAHFESVASRVYASCIHCEIDGCMRIAYMVK